MSPRVPRALRELGFRTIYVGNTADGAPPRGSPDSAVLDFAQRTSQVIVTSNHDMMLICAEAGRRFVWLDPRGRQYSAIEQVLVAFRQIQRWEQLLAAAPDACIRSMRTRCEAITADEAARLAGQRMRVLRRRQRSRRVEPLGSLLAPRRPPED